VDNHKCNLCGSDSRLQKSHIIPKFVISYLKETSATGFIRHGVNINVRKQDMPKIELLCFSCEQLFSKREKRFSEKFFMKYHTEEATRFEYEEWLRYFAISAFWRFAITQVNDFEIKHPSLGLHIREAINKWTPFLLEHTNNPADYQYDMFILDIVTPSHPDVHIDGMNWLLLRGVDGTIFFNSDNKTVGIYFKIPGFLFCCHLKPNKNKLWKGTTIKRRGIISAPQHVKDKRFGSFLLHRLRRNREMFDNMSDNQKDKTMSSYLRNIDAMDEKVLEIIRADSMFYFSD
jgi:hypothetical protein